MMMMIPKFVDLWIADAEGCAIAGPILGEMRWRDEHRPAVGEMDIAVAPTKELTVKVPEGYAHPLMIQAYDLDDDETMLGWWPLWIYFGNGESFSMGAWK